MKYYFAYYRYYDDRTDLGLFSSEEAAQEALEHFYVSQGDFTWFERSQGYVDEYSVDEYTLKHLSPLAKALQEDE